MPLQVSLYESGGNDLLFLSHTLEYRWNSPHKTIQTLVKNEVCIHKYIYCISAIQIRIFFEYFIYQGIVINLTLIKSLKPSE